MCSFGIYLFKMLKSNANLYLIFAFGIVFLEFVMCSSHLPPIRHATSKHFPVFEIISLFVHLFPFMYRSYLSWCDSISLFLILLFLLIKSETKECTCSNSFSIDIVLFLVFSAFQGVFIMETFKLLICVQLLYIIFSWNMLNLSTYNTVI